MNDLGDIAFFISFWSVLILIWLELRAIRKNKEIVKQYLEKGEKCREQSAEHNEQEAFNFWDGFVSCAENILRELE